MLGAMINFDPIIRKSEATNQNSFAMDNLFQRHHLGSRYPVIPIELGTASLSGDGLPPALKGNQGHPGSAKLHSKCFAQRFIFNWRLIVYQDDYKWIVVVPLQLIHLDRCVGNIHVYLCFKTYKKPDVLRGKNNFKPGHRLEEAPFHRQLHMGGSGNREQGTASFYMLLWQHLNQTMAWSLISKKKDEELVFSCLWHTIYRPESPNFTPPRITHEPSKSSIWFIEKSHRSIAWSKLLQFVQDSQVGESYGHSDASTSSGLISETAARLLESFGHPQVALFISSTLRQTVGLQSWKMLEKILGKGVQ